MSRVSLARTTAFRLAVLVATIVSLAFVASGFVSYRLIRAESLALLDQRIVTTANILLDQQRTAGTPDMLETIGAMRRSISPGGPYVRATDATGAVLGGTAMPTDVAKGWSVIKGVIGPGVEPHQYRVLSLSADGLNLAIAIDRTEVIEVDLIILKSLGWSALAALAVALSGGALIASTVRKRQDYFTNTMDRIAEGDLAARVPLSGRSDDLDQLSDAINAALDRLNRLIEGMRQVSNDIAHDLRTPLNRLKLGISEAVEKNAAGKGIATELGTISAEVDTINQTFQALLRIAQIEAGARREKFAEVDLAAVARDLTDVYESVVEDAGMRLTWDIPTTPVLLTGDRDLLMQATVNLIENAIRHCPQGTTIHCRVSAADQHAVLEVRDTGPGIPEAERENVFRRLYRLDKSRSTPGSGLGLSLVRAITDLHGARITLADANPGLVVQIDFPPVADSETADFANAV